MTEGWGPGATATAVERLGVDPVTFEILRHRLWAINEEAATTLKLVSGSTVANEANDFNTAVMDADGDVVAFARYSLAKATTMSLVVKDVLTHYKENPGIHPGDGFVCNDPYLGVQHQNDVAFIMPFFHGDELVGWTGAEVHQVDVGGPVPGTVQVGAQDIFGEAPLIPPLKIVEASTLRNDIERNFLRRSRTPELLALEFRAQWAACNVSTERLGHIADQYGVGVLREVMQEVLTYAETRFRARLSELPDGTWRHVTYLDYLGDIYPIKIAMTKRGDGLIFDFEGTARQAPALINCTHTALVAVISGAICVGLCWDIPWCPTAFARAIEVRSPRGSVVSCEWPAGVCKSTSSVSWSMLKSVGLLAGRLVGCHDGWREKAMASWNGASCGEEIAGVDWRGHEFVSTIIDAMGGAGGAGTFRDGIDTGGYFGSPGIRIANVETYEMEYPILYLYRRQVRDGGGPGRFRGGVSLEKAYVTSGVDELPEFVAHGIGIAMPLSSGSYGGYPAGTNQLSIKRATNVRELLASGKLPEGPDDLSGDLEVAKSILRTRLSSDDVYFAVVMGGGGYGDPLEREPAHVVRDHRAGLISKWSAEGIYGVVLTSDGHVDDAATGAVRDEIRARRLAEASPAKPFLAPGDPLERVLSAGDRIDLLESRGRVRFIGCRCGCMLSPADENYKDRVPELRRPIQYLGRTSDPHNVGAGSFQLREYYCPSCAVLLSVDILEAGEPTVWELELMSAAETQ